ncbi:MAG: type II secretion system F family protein [Deltaproteobacteria bacterium]|nr:type II secretion system F family protein [Deltaproteobacteria bacterium]
MIILVTLAICGAAFFLTTVTVQIFSRLFERYRERYHVESLEQVTDMFIVIDDGQRRVLSLATMALFFSLGLLLSPILAVILALVGLIAPSFYLRYLKQARVENFDHQLADALVAIAGAMRSGFTFRQAMTEVAANAHAPLGQEFKVFTREMQLGTPLDEALDHLAERVGSTELDLFVSASQIALKVGGNVAEMFDKLAGTLRERFRLEGRIRTLTAQGKLQGVIIGLMPIFVWAGFDYFRPDLTRPMLQHWFGYAVIILIVVMELMGALVIRRIVQIEL